MNKNQIKGSGSQLLDNTGCFILILGIIVGGLMIFSGITNVDASPQYLGTGIGIIFISIIIYAFARVQVSINDNLEALKNYKRAEYKEAHQVKEGEHFDPLKD